MTRTIPARRTGRALGTALWVALACAPAARAQDPAPTPAPPPTAPPDQPAASGRERALEARLRAVEERLKQLEAPKEEEPARGDEDEAERGPLPSWVGAALRGVELHAIGVGSYTWNLADPRRRQGANLTRVSDLDHDTFSPTFFKLGLSRPVSGENAWDAGVRLEVAAGTMVEETLSLDSRFLGGRPVNLANAYVELQVPSCWGHPLKVRAGRAYGWFGLDSLDLWDSPLFSHSYYSNYTPFTNTGLFLETELGGGFSYMQYVGNGSEVVVDNNRSKSVGGRLAWTQSDDLSVALCWIWGNEREANEHDARWQTELDLSWSPLERTDLYLMLHYGQEEGQALGGGTAKFGGGSLALRQGLLAPSAEDADWSLLSLLARVSYLRDQGGVNTGLDQALTELTGGVEVKPLEFAWLRLEYRADLSTQPNAFLGHRARMSRRWQSTLTVALGFGF
ncbi:MAG: outer membrane beta-barrel protein [Planctomycetota bacterium]